MVMVVLVLPPFCRLWGEHGQRLLERASVCLLHANGLGTELLKNLVLPGERCTCCECKGRGEGGPYLCPLSSSMLLHGTGGGGGGNVRLCECVCSCV